MGDSIHPVDQHSPRTRFTSVGVPIADADIRISSPEVIFIRRITIGIVRIKAPSTADHSETPALSYPKTAGWIPVISV